MSTDDHLLAARAVENLLGRARNLLLDAQRCADDGRLLMIGRWIKERVESLDSELLVEVRATVKALEKRQAEWKEPKP